MMYIVIFMPSARFATEGLPADFWDVELAEQAQARVLYAGGRLRRTWAIEDPDDPSRHGAVVQFEAADRADLESAIATFPFVQRDYCRYEVVPIGPYPGFFAGADRSRARS